MENDKSLDLDRDNIEETDFGTDEGQNVDYKALYQEANRKVNKLKNKLYAKGSEDTDKPITNSLDAGRLDKLDLKVDGYSDEEAEYILHNGGKAALASNPFLKTSIEVLREQKKAEQAILAGEGQKSGASTGGMSPDAFSKLSADEQLKALSNLK